MMFGVMFFFFVSGWVVMLSLEIYVFLFGGLSFEMGFLRLSTIFSISLLIILSIFFRKSKKSVHFLNLYLPVISSSPGHVSPPSTSHSPNSNPSSKPTPNNASPSSPPQTSVLITTRSIPRITSSALPKATPSQLQAKTSSRPSSSQTRTAPTMSCMGRTIRNGN